jgi:hypothetical protein
MSLLTFPVLLSGVKRTWSTGIWLEFETTNGELLLLITMLPLPLLVLVFMLVDDAVADVVVIDTPGPICPG